MSAGDRAEPLSLPTGTLDGAVTVPVSKSVSQRVLNLALLARQPLDILNPPTDDDSRAFAGALESLGWEIDESAIIETASGGGESGWRLTPPATLPRKAEVDCASSGTAFRLLTASLSTLPGRWRLTGSEQLAARPIEDLLAALKSAGAKVRKPRGRSLPLKITGRAWTASELTVDASTSSQYLSALLMAAAVARPPKSGHPLAIHASGLVSAPYVDLTLDRMRRFGVEVEAPVGEFQEGEFRVSPGLAPPQQVWLEGDWSSACYPAAAAALTGGRVVVEGLEAWSAQADRGFLDVLRQMGAEVTLRDDTVIVEGTGSLTAVDVDLNSMPDQVPTLACLAPFAAGTTTIRGVAHLRHKESDRLAVLSRELTRLGAEVEEREDGLRIPGVWNQGSIPTDAVDIDPEGDHRIAMAVAVLAARRPGVRMRAAEVVEKSYAGFWQDWTNLTVTDAPPAAGP